MSNSVVSFFYSNRVSSRAFKTVALFVLGWAILLGNFAHAVTWTATSPGDLLNSANWGGTTPNSIGAVATVSTQPTNSGNFSLNGTMTMGTLDYLNSSARQITGTGTLQFQVSSGTALLRAQNNSLTLAIPTLNLASDTTMQVVPSNATLLIQSAISGNGGIIKTGAGVLKLSNAVANSNNYAGSTSIQQGTLLLGAADQIPDLSAVTVSSGATLDLAFDETIGSLTGSGNVNFLGTDVTVGGNDQSTVYSGNLSGIASGTLTKLGTGTLTLTGTNSNYYHTLVEGGTLNITNNGKVSNTSSFSSRIGNNSGSNGTVNVGGLGSSTWLNDNYLYIGNSGTGTLNITGGGTVSNQMGYVGYNIGSTGTVNVGGGTGNSNWTFTQGRVLNVGYAGDGTLNITGGGAVSTQDAWIGIESTGNGTVNVGGGTGNSTWTNTESLYVGYSGTAMLNIIGGGTVAQGSSGFTNYIGYNSGSSGTVNVGGGTGNSNWTLANLSGLHIGYFGTGTLNITGGGKISGGYGTLGFKAGSNGTINIGGGSGASSWSQSGGLSVGVSGTGTLNITGGGTVSSQTNNYIAESTGSSGTVNIGGGTGKSTWTGGDLHVGNSGTGILNITSGGTVSSLDGNIGRNSGSIGTVTIRGGTDSAIWICNSSMYIGNSGTGILTVTDGGSVTSRFFSTSAYIGYNSGSNGTVNVGGGTGTSSWNNLFSLRVGSSGKGVLNITGGGNVSSSSGMIGDNSSSNGTVNVGGGTGSSTWTNSSSLNIGWEGKGILNITGGGTVSNASASIGFYSGSNGTVTVGGGVGNSIWTNTDFLIVGSSGTGILNINTGGLVSATKLDGGNGAGGIKFDGGTLRITSTDSAFNRIELLTQGGTLDIPTTGTTFTVTSAISGAGSLTKTGIGRLELSGPSTYSNGTIVSAGTLLASNTTGSATGTGPVSVLAGATLGGTGSIGGNIQIDGGVLAPGTSIGTLKTSGSLALDAGSFAWEYNSNSPPTADLMNVFGALSIDSDVTLSVTNLGTALIPIGRKFTLISYGTAGNPGRFANMPDDAMIIFSGKRFIINYNDTPTGSVNGGLYANAVTLTAVPEPASCIFACLVAVATLAIVRSRNTKRRAKLKT